MAIQGFTEYAKEDGEKYNKRRWWLGMTWGDMLDKATDLYPDKIGLVDDVGCWTFSQVRENVDRLAIGLMKLGIKPLDRVLLQLPNWHEYIYAFFAFQKIGVITVLLIPRHSQLEINHLAKLTEPVAWVLPERYGKVDYQPIVDAVLKQNPGIKHIVKVRAGKETNGLTLDQLIGRRELTKENLKALEDRRPDPDEVSHILPTGGTTGLPKASPRTHNCYITNIEYHSRAWELTSKDTLMVITPVGHSMAMHWGIGAAFLNYAKLVLLDSVKAEDICERIQAEKVTALPSVPALIARMIGMKGLEKYDLSSLKSVSIGGAPSTPELVRSVYETLKCTFINAFGSSEGTNTATRPGDSIDIICNSVGRPVCPYDTIKIIDDAGKEVPPGVEGELVSKGPGIFTGYFKSPEENSQIFTKDGFFKTGDKARKDAHGNITITGRIKDIIIRGGEKISPADIEKLVRAHPNIHEVAVIGMPDPILGERICAYVVLEPGASLTFEEVVAFLKEKGGSVQQLPERIEFVESLPVTKVGKIDKKALRDDIKKKLS